jgi:hypothetical protein
MPNIEWTPIQIEIARQIHNAKPDALVPGEDVGMHPEGDTSILVRIVVERVVVRRVTVTYDAGPDTYTVRIEHRRGVDELAGIYCDQLGELIFGDDAKAWDEPFATIVMLDANGVPDSIDVIR